ncbi:MAG: GTPase domain-containing protein, partial [Burkholderiales bacterium]|nr:GTPase domain-containing protein [Burkholderiales bacterium]
MSTVTLSLVSHTNAGKTTLARTLLRQDIGEIRDAPHVTEFETAHDLIASDAGDVLRLWDTPGFSDAARLLRRMRLDGHPLGWLLSEVWDRWRDRAFWSSQRALRHVQAESDVVLYLVNATESPAAAAYVEAEMELLGWVGKPVLVLLNQLGAPRDAAAEAADVGAWRSHLQRWPGVRAVLPLDAFARCWVHERRLLVTVQGLLEGEPAAAMARLTQAWTARGEAVFAASMRALAESLARVALARETLDGETGWVDRIRRVGAAVA